MKRSTALVAAFVTAAMLVPYAGNIRVHAAGDVRINEANFPDPNFRAVVASATYDRDQDGYISEYEGTYVNNMHCENRNITSLEGIEYFPGITGLWCLNNALTDMDLSGNPNLVGIYCNDNLFTELDLSDCPNLEWIYCFNCQLTSLDISHNPKMAYLECNNNPELGSLDLSQNDQLEHLFCSECGLTSLDLSHNPMLSEVDAFKNHLTELDVSNNHHIRRLDVWDNPDLGNIDVSGLPKLQLLNIAETNCDTIDVTHNPELQALFAGWNEDVISIDLSNNPQLTDLRIDCNYNMTSLDLSHNPRIYYALLYGLNSLSTLDISGNPHLQAAYNRGYVVDERNNLGRPIHSYTIEYGGSDEYFDDLTHCLCINDELTVINTGNTAVTADSYIDTNDGHSSSEQFATRGQAVQILYELAGSPDVPGVSRFTDVAGTPYADAVRWAEVYNVCFGYPMVSSETFCPDELIDRETFALMAHRFAGRMGQGTAYDYGRTDWWADTLDIDYFGWGAFTWAIQFNVLFPSSDNYVYPHGRMTLSEVQNGANKVFDLDEAASYSARVGGNGPGTEGAAELPLYRDRNGIGYYVGAEDPSSGGAGGSGSSGSGSSSGTSSGSGASGSSGSSSGSSSSGSSSSGSTSGSGSSSSGSSSGSSAGATPTPAIPTRSPSAPSTSSEGGVAGFVERLYTIALGRASDPVGKQDWIDAITLRGETGASAARGFLFSPEFLNKDCTDEEFVAVLYRTFFDREPDQDGFNAWVGVLRNGTSKEEIIEGFINSTEWANLCLFYGIRSGGTGSPSIEVEPNQDTIEFATRLYTTCLGRSADQAGLMAWARQLANQRDTGTGAARGFFFSSEFTGQNVSNAEYVNRLYRTFMGREADEAGFNAWVGQLDSGVSREEVFDGFAESIEFARICASYGIVR